MKLCKPEQCSRQMNESEESASELFEAHSDSAMIFDLHEKAFNKMPFFVVIEIGVPWINWVRLWRNTEVSVMVGNVFTVFPWTIGFVSENSTAGNIELFKTILKHDPIMYLSAGELQYQGITESIHYRVDFGWSSPSADSNMLMIIISRSPFFAPALDRCALI